MDDWTPHELLLALAGRVDDDLLGWARELVAAGDAARAVGLLTATLVADRTVLPGPVHAAVVHACRATRTDLDAALLPAGPDDRPVHRFEPAVNAGVEAAVRELPAHEIEGCRVLVASRATPAGTAPGPLPHPVVLVEVEPGGKPTDVLAHQLAAALSRAGVRASVEVLTAGRPLSDYHAAALQAARPVHDRAPGHAASGDVPVVTPISAPPPDLQAPRHGTPPVTRPQAPAYGTPASIGTPASVGTPSSEATAEFAAVDTTAGPTDLTPEGRRPAFTDTPTFAEMQDPLLGPLSSPLLDPLLDPTLGRLMPLATPAGSPAAAPSTVADPVQDSWTSEWASGTWAMSPSALTDRGPAGAVPADPEGSDAEPPVPGQRRARHRSDDEPDAGTGPDAGAEPAPEAGDGPPPQWFAPAHVEPPPTPPREPPEQVAPRLGPPRDVTPQPVPSPLPAPAPEPAALSPDHAPEADRSSSARLSDADRDLLARLQAELADGRRPRAGQEPGVDDDPASTNGSAADGSAGPTGTAPQPRIDPRDFAE